MICEKNGRKFVVVGNGVNVGLAVGELPAELGERVGEAADLVVAALVVRADRVDRAVDLVLDVLRDGWPVSVDMKLVVHTPAEVLEVRPAVGADQRDLRLGEHAARRRDRATADDAGQRDDLVVLDELVAAGTAVGAPSPSSAIFRSIGWPPSLLSCVAR